jgi:hypothetical protein
VAEFKVSSSGQKQGVKLVNSILKGGFATYGMAELKLSLKVKKSP